MKKVFLLADGKTVEILWFDDVDSTYMSLKQFRKENPDFPIIGMFAVVLE